LLAENIIAFYLFQKVKSQHILSFGGPVDLNLGTLMEVLGMYSEKYMLSISEKIEVFEAVHFCYNIYLGEVYPDQFGTIHDEDEDEDEE